MSIAGAICAVSDEASAWNIIRANHECFLWTDDEEPEATWNRLADGAGDHPRLSVRWDDDDRPVLELAGSALKALLVFDRDDRFIRFEAIAKIGKRILELRFCRASAHSSDQAYLACPPDAWAALELAFGKDRVEQHFQILPLEEPR